MSLEHVGNVVQLRLDHSDAKRAEEEFLALLDECNKQGRHVSYQSAARNYAPRAFSCNGGTKRKVYEEAMVQLFKQQRIHAETYGGHRVRIVRSEAEIISFPHRVG